MVQVVPPPQGSPQAPVLTQEQGDAHLPPEALVSQESNPVSAGGNLTNQSPDLAILIQEAVQRGIATEMQRRTGSGFRPG